MDLFEDSRIYTVKQVAEPLEAHENFVWREIRKGHLRAVKLTAKFIRLRGRDVNEWLERGVTPPSIKEPGHTKELQDA
jgi:excisionase family DNA binding protein